MCGMNKAMESMRRSDMQQQHWIKTTTNNAGADMGEYIQGMQADQREATNGEEGDTGRVHNPGTK
jgi:hypothetical protein